MAGRDCIHTQPFSSGNSFLRKARLNEEKMGGEQELFFWKKTSERSKASLKK